MKLLNKMKYKLYKEDISDDLLNHYRMSNLIAVDTELTGLNLSRDKICLIQFSDGLGANAIVQVHENWVPKNSKSILENESIRKVFHHAPVDVSFLRADLDINTRNFHCTKLMSKVVRTYTDKHGLSDLSEELFSKKMDKTIRQSCFFYEKLSKEQEEYAIKDVLDLLDIYRELNEMIDRRGMTRSGISCRDANDQAQLAMKHMIPLLVSGYGGPDSNWDLGWMFKY